MIMHHNGEEKRLKSYQKTYQEWLNSNNFDEETKAELLKIQNDERNNR